MIRHATAVVGSATSVRAMPGLSDFVAVVNALQDPVPEQFARDFQVSTIHHPVPDEFLDTAVATSLRLPSRVWRGIMAGMLATAPASQLGSPGVPTLIMSGERDPIFPPEAQRDLRAQLPRARSVSYPATGHAPQLGAAGDLRRGPDIIPSRERRPVAWPLRWAGAAIRSETESVL